jgi:hypothetical protein
VRRRHDAVGAAPDLRGEARWGAAGDSG